MKIKDVHIGQRVEHPHHGMGVVKKISEHVVDVDFNGDVKTVDPETGNLEPFEAKVDIKGLEVPLAQFVRGAVDAALDSLGIERPDPELLTGLGAKWGKGIMVLRPSDPALQPKEVPVEAFFHKIVMMRNNLRVLEQKINAHPGLSDGDKVEIQQYISRCYGSMTTFNALFKDRADYFSSKDE
jgi:hypothetical protein